MNKKAYFLLMFTIILFMSNFIVVNAQEFTLNSFFEDGVVATISDVKQKYEFWSFSNFDSDNLKDLVNSLSDIRVKPKENIPEFDPSMKLYYISYYGDKNGDKSINIYKDGTLIMKEIGGNGEIRAYDIVDFYDFKNEINIRLSTQNSGYRQRFSSETKVFVTSKWANPYVERAIKYNLDILPVAGDMREFITRELFCDIFTEDLKNAKNTDAKIEANYFLDTINLNVDYLYEREIIKGKSKANFCPNDFISREEGATIIYRILNYIGYKFEEHSSVKKYDDDEDISDWAKEAVYKLRDLEVMVGMDNNEFLPKTNLTKEQAIKMALILYEDFIVSTFERQFVQVKGKTAMITEDVEAKEPYVIDTTTSGKIFYRNLYYVNDFKKGSVVLVLDESEDKEECKVMCFCGSKPYVIANIDKSKLSYDKELIKNTANYVNVDGVTGYYEMNKDLPYVGVGIAEVLERRNNLIKVMLEENGSVLWFSVNDINDTFDRMVIDVKGSDE